MRPHHFSWLYRAFWFEAGVAVARFLGVHGARRLGRALGYSYAWAHPRTRRAVRDNLAAVCGPAFDSRLVGRTFANFGATLADYFTLGACPKAGGLALIEVKSGFEHIQAARAEGKGALLVTAHLGLFELGGLVLEDSNVPLVVLSLPEPDPCLNRWRAAYRRRWRAETLEVGGDEFSFLDVARQLAQGKCAALLMDRPLRGAEAVLAEVAHGSIPFSTGPAWLSLLSGSPLVAVTMTRRASGRYEMVAHPPLKPIGNGGGRSEAVRQTTRQLAAIFCKTICAYPDQWYQFVPLCTAR